MCAVCGALDEDTSSGGGGGAICACFRLSRRGLRGPLLVLLTEGLKGPDYTVHGRILVDEPVVWNRSFRIPGVEEAVVRRCLVRFVGVADIGRTFHPLPDGDVGTSPVTAVCWLLWRPVAVVRPPLLWRSGAERGGAGRLGVLCATRTKGHLLARRSMFAVPPVRALLHPPRCPRCGAVRPGLGRCYRESIVSVRHRR